MTKRNFAVFFISILFLAIALSGCTENRVCGNTICEWGESYENCPSDCAPTLKGNLQVTVIDSITKAPIQGAYVSATMIPTVPPYEPIAVGTTDASGIARFRPSVGTYIIEASSKGYDSADANAVIAPGITTYATIALKPATTGDLIVRVSDSNTLKAIAGATVKYALKGTDFFTTTTDRLGDALIKSLKTGTYEIIVTKDGYEEKHAEGEVKTGDTTLVKTGLITQCTTDAGCTVPTYNEKDMSQYSDKEVFLISDEDWKNVLSSISVAVWTNGDGSISKYPLLIYHKENDSFDIDSIYYFLNQYNASKISYFGTLPTELNSLLAKSYTLTLQQNVFGYWKNFRDIVYVEDNYELALIASTYASLINAPLIIKGTGNDNSNIFSGKQVICVGNVNPAGNSCKEQYNLEQLQNRYIEKTNSGKLVLINPLDKSIFIYEDNFKPEKSSKNIHNIYSFDSLAAPILASGKHELIITTSDTDYSLVNLDIKSAIQKLNLNPKYLTIIGSPDAIRNYKENIVATPGSSTQYVDSEVEWTYYSDIDNDEIPDLSIGRIYGITVSDTSSYIARSLFIDLLPKSRKYIILSEPNGLAMGVGAVSLKKYFESSLDGSTDFFETWGAVSKDYIEKNVLDKTLISTHSHGGTNGAMITSGYNLEGLYFSPSIYLADACFTCAYQPASPKQYLFCTTLLRKGVMGVVGAVDMASSTISKFMYYVGKNQDLGAAMKNFKTDLYSKVVSIDKVRDTDGSYQAGLHEVLKGNYILLGDPTINLNFNIPKNNNQITYELNTISSNEKKLTINIPSPTELSQEVWGGEKLSYWIIPSYENVIIPFLIKGTYQNDVLKYQEAVGNIQIKDSSINPSYYPISVTYIDKNGGRTNFNFVESDPRYQKTWRSPNNEWHYMQIGVLGDRMSIILHNSEDSSGVPILENSSYEIIFSVN